MIYSNSLKSNPSTQSTQSYPSEAQIGTAIFSHALSSAAEMYSFTALGLSVYRFQAKDWSIRYTAISMLGLLIARGAVVFGTFGFTALVAPRSFDVSRQEQWALFGAGLMRGAITWAQALQMQGDNRRVMNSTTLVVISTTLVIVGGLLPSALRALGLVENETHDEGEIAGVHEALTVRRQESVRIDGEGSAGASFSSPHEIVEITPGRLSRQTSADAAEEGQAGSSSGGGGETMPLITPPPPSTSATSASEPRPPRRPPSLSVPAHKLAPNGRMPSGEEGPVLYGPLHRVWVHLDERFLKPVFGGTFVVNFGLWAICDWVTTVQTTHPQKKTNTPTHPT